ncbi:MAG: hypothetical protein WA902_13815, partial [Thermosynechococcaceae cyanobacterium]
TQTSGEAEIKLAQHLSAQGAKLYGTHWSFHTYQQIELFGIEAFESVPYIECTELIDGRECMTSQCQAFVHEVRAISGEEGGFGGFPTWSIGDQIYGGCQTLANLAKYSGYQGAISFKNIAPDDIRRFRPSTLKRWLEEQQNVSHPIS